MEQNTFWNHIEVRSITCRILEQSGAGHGTMLCLFILQPPPMLGDASNPDLLFLRWLLTSMWTRTRSQMVEEVPDVSSGKAVCEMIYPSAIYVKCLECSIVT